MFQSRLQCDGNHYSCVEKLFTAIGDRFLIDLLKQDDRAPVLQHAREALEEQGATVGERDEAARFVVRDWGRPLVESNVPLFAEANQVARHAMQFIYRSSALARAEILRRATTDACTVDECFVRHARRLLVKNLVYRTKGLVDTLNGGGSASLFILAPEGDGDHEHGRGRHISPDRPVEATMEKDNEILVSYYLRYQSDVLSCRCVSSDLERLSQEVERALACAYANLILLGLRERGVV